MLFLTPWHLQLNMFSFLSFYSRVNNITSYDLIFNVLANASIIACRQSGRDVIAYEDDVFIFKKVFIPLYDKETHAAVVAVRSRSSLDDEDVPSNLD